MSRPDQHPRIERWLLDKGLPATTWRALVHLTFAPPNLRFAGPIFTRLDHLLHLTENPFGALPGPITASDLSHLLTAMRRHAATLDPEVLNDFVAPPSRDKDPHLSPLNHYCVSEYPVWCALTLSSSGAGALPFDRFAASVIGEMIRFAHLTVTEESYLDYRNRWQRRREKEARAKERLELHPLGSKLSAMAEVERCLRGLTLSEHDEAWQCVAANGHSRPEDHLDDPAVLPSRFSATRQLLDELYAAQERFESTSSRAQRKLSQLRRNPHFQPLGRGRYILGLDWIVEVPDKEDGKKSVAEVFALPQRAQHLLSHDFALEEFAEPTGLVMYVPEGADKLLPQDALQVTTKWSYQAQQSRNQLLRWTLDSLTVLQVAELLRILCAPETDLSKESESDLESRMLWMASLNTGIQRVSLREDLQISRSTRKTLTTRVEYLLQPRLFRIATNLPDLADILADRAAARARNFIHIPDRIGFHLVAEEYLRRNNGGLDPVRLAVNHSVADRLRDAIAAIGIRESQVYQCLPRKVLERTGSIASIALWGDFRPSIAKTLTHYLSPAASAVERPIDAALIDLVSTAKQSVGFKIMRYVDNVTHIKGDRRIGAPNCPSSGDTAALIDAYAIRLDVTPQSAPDALAAYSNAFTSYHAFFQTAALGYRAAIDPSPHLFEINGQWFAIFSDKDSKGFHQRIVAVPKVFVLQLRHFDRHQMFMRSLPYFDFAKAPTGTMLWFSGTKAIPFSPTHAASDAGPSWKYRINALRRRMRTRLFERGAPGESSDVWMGQWTLGNCPWMSGSAFQPSELVELVNRHVSPILEEDGWKPIESILTRGLPWATD